MKKSYSIILLVLLLAVNLYQIQRYKQLKTAYGATRVVPSTQNNNKVKQMIADEFGLIDVVNVELEDGDSISLKEILSTPKLILRVSEFNCGSCVDSTLLILHKYAPQLKDHVVILANITNGRNRIVFKRVHGLNDYQFFYLSENSIPLNAEKSPSPYFFMMDSSLRAQLVFVPNKKDAALTVFYLKKVISLLNTDKD